MVLAAYALSTPHGLRQQQSVKNRNTGSRLNARSIMDLDVVLQVRKISDRGTSAIFDIGSASFKDIEWQL
jgi:hypothetical protein